MGIFQQIASGPETLKKDLLGPTYNYWDWIVQPTDVHSDGVWVSDDAAALTVDTKAMISYIQLLTDGGGTKGDQNITQKVPGGLGAKFFLPTGGTCKDDKTGQLVSRYIYIDNAPGGTGPDIFGKSSRGLIPGIIDNIVKVADIPFEMIGSITDAMGGTPTCVTKTLPTIDGNGKIGSASHWITEADAAQINESFTNYSKDLNSSEYKDSSKDSTFSSNLQSNVLVSDKLPNDKLIKLFYTLLGVGGLYILWRVCNNCNKK